LTIPLAELLVQLERLPGEARQAFDEVADEHALNHVKARFLGKQGALTAISKHLRELSPDERPRLGQALNAAREALEGALEGRREAMRGQARQRDLERTRVDLTLPARRPPVGGLHVLKRVERELIEIFRSMGYSVAVGPEIETDFHNFEALNFPPDHPARDMQDTLLLENGHLLRTHTSPVQIRTMLANEPPIRIIAPGTVYRCDADVTHSPMFSQIEGLLVDRKVSMADLKGTLLTFVRRFFGPDVQTRLRPSFFPFTEPSVELDVYAPFRPSGWLEVLGAGMVDPNVFRAVGYDPEEVTGFAFGLGIERMAMLKYGIDNIRLLFENDVRFLRQFA
jgi:phenylalanyl-tRNA synthetase alpha chain